MDRVVLWLEGYPNFYRGSGGKFPTVPLLEKALRRGMTGRGTASGYGGMWSGLVG
jgi:hypothetical protein